MNCCDNAYDFVVGCKGRVVDFEICVDITQVSNEFVFITEDGQQVFYTEDGQKFRPENWQ